MRRYNLDLYDTRCGLLYTVKKEFYMQLDCSFQSGFIILKLHFMHLHNLDLFLIFFFDFNVFIIF